MRWVVCLLLGVAAGLGTQGGLVAAAAAEKRDRARFFPVEEVRPGLKGYGLTVVEGTRVDRFDVEILGLVKGVGPAGDLILLRVSGPLVDAAGGIASGMSGSPVYVDGRLVGAIGFGFEFSERSVGLATPIGDMLQVLRLLEPPGAAQKVGGSPGALSRAARSGPAAGPAGAPGFRRVVLAPSEVAAGELKAGLGPDAAVMVPVATPVMVGGLGPRARALLEKALRPYPLLFVPQAAVPVGGSVAQEPAPPLEPGSSLGVSLVRGDVSLTLIGTVTYVEGDRFVAFGHPLLQKGAVHFFAGPARILGMVPSVRSPFKFGISLAPTGVVVQDRRAGVAGLIGQQVDSVRLTVEVQDLTTGRTRALKAEVVRDDVLTLPLVAVAGLEALDRGLDRVGPGTARLVYRIRASGLPGSGSFSRDNVFFSRTDVSAWLLGDFLDTLDALMFNRFQDLDVREVHLSVQVDDRRRTAAIVGARPLATEVSPGESVAVEVELLPYRGRRETRVLSLHIPETAAPGTVNVTVRGGAYEVFGLPSELATILTEGGQPDGEPPGKKGGEPLPGDEVAPSLDKFLEMLGQREKNNQIVAEFYPGYSGPADEGEARSGPGRRAGRGRMRPPGAGNHEGAPGSEGEEPGLGPGEAVKAVLTTPWVVEGSADFTLTIREGEGREGPGDGEPARPPDTLTRRRA